jgi:outer membrane lipoprotein SlyB
VPRVAARDNLARDSACASCGTVESIRTVELKGDASGLGAVAGGVTGAAVGNQMGRGNGNTAMTIFGAAGDALGGNEIEKSAKKHISYRVTVRMDDGSFRTLSQTSAPAVAVGERVRVVDSTVIARS